MPVLGCIFILYRTTLMRYAAQMVTAENSTNYPIIIIKINKAIINLQSINNLYRLENILLGYFYPVHMKLFGPVPNRRLVKKTIKIK
jgi:hypothetical protein